MFTSRAPICLVLIGLYLSCVSTAHAKVLLQAHFDDATAHADYALGNTVAQSAVAKTYKVAGVSDGGRWGRALDLSQASANCTFDAAQNFNSMRGTAQMWFRIAEHKQGMYHPLFGWYRPPHQPGAKKRHSALEVYLHNTAMVLGLHTPKSSSTLKAAPVEVGRWHHLEINWDCERGTGHSVYNIFLDGKNLIRVIDAQALEDGDGARLHLGIWDYGFSHILRGKIDELRITDQIEHSTDFIPPAKPYARPGTIAYAKATHLSAIERLKQFDGEIKSLMKFSGSAGDSAAARVIRQSRATATDLERKLASLKSPLSADDPDVAALCKAVDAVADQLSIARLPIHRITTKAAALAAREDRRSLLFKDLNDTLVGQAIILNGQQLFIDDYMIQQIQGARRVMNPAVTVLEELPKHVSRLRRGSLLYDRSQKRFKLWCILESADRAQQALCYNTSTNGIDWQTPQTHPPLALGDQVSFYEHGLNRLHGFNRETALARGRLLAADRRDRFVSVEAEDEGVLTTRRFIAIGDTLVLNAQAAKGEIRVEAIDALGRVITGFSKDDCKPITGDKIGHAVSWTGGTNCHPLQARPIKLRFYIRRAKLFSFDFQIRHNHYVPETYRQK